MSTPSLASAGGGHTPSKDGELALLEYELWSDSPGGTPELIDTTREEVASKANLKTPEGFVFGPRAHIIGGEYFPAGIEAVLSSAPMGQEFTKEFPPAEAFGERDPKLIELFSMHEISRLPEMRREDADLEIGTVLTIKGRRGRVISLTAARVRVDFNAPLAGRKVRGTFRLLELIRDPAEQVRGLLDVHYGRGKEFHVEVKGEEVTVTVPDRSKFDFGWMAAKPRIIDRIRAHLKPRSIRLVEEYVTPTPKESAVAAKASATSKTPEAKKEHASSHAHDHGSAVHKTGPVAEAAPSNPKG
jgi:FKBP-type peptidyl-prolyl cis-trans isomerase 2